MERAHKNQVVPAAAVAWSILLCVLVAACGGRTPLEQGASPLTAGDAGVRVDAGSPADGGITPDGAGGPDSPPGVCNRSTCTSGCCDSAGVCQPGTDPATCGRRGQACKDCIASGGTCLPNSQGGSCQGVSTCDAQSCPSGCCDMRGRCRNGTKDTACGGGGGQCQDCTMFGSTCAGQQCTMTTTCDPQSCPNGCCATTGRCRRGTNPRHCGTGGMACQDCTAGGGTCMNQQCAGTQPCPGPYSGCMIGPPVVLTKQHVCSAAELQGAATICAMGISASPQCVTYLTLLAGQDPACDACLTPFEVDFDQPSGVIACATPFVSTACAQAAQCFADCVTTSCSGCSGTMMPQCLMQGGGPNCAAYAQGDACVSMALTGPASVCNPSTYQGNFGAWLAGVGAAYCGM